MNAPAFHVKSAQLMLLALVLDSPHAADLAAHLERHSQQDPDYFRGQGVLLDLQHLRPENKTPCDIDDSNNAESQDNPQENPSVDIPDVDFEAFSSVLNKYGMRLAAVRSGAPAHMQAATAAGLICAPDLPKSKPKKAPTEPAPATQPVEVRVEVPVEIRVEVPVEVPVVRPTLVVQRSLRSGQQVYARDANLVLIGAVSASAEVIADGDVHVYGSLHGRAVAGARGERSARIFSTHMQPQLLSIAGNYRAFEDGLPSHIEGKAAQAWLDDSEKLLIEALGTSTK